MLIPVTGLRGIYSLAPPFENDIKFDEVYVCQAVRKFEDLLAKGEDPYEAIYLPKEIDESIYQRDVMNAVPIISLQSKEGRIIRVPASYILSIPAIDGIEYHVMMLAITIGMIPTYLDLTVVKEQIEATVKHVLGIKSSDITEIVTSAPVIKSIDEHDAIETSRKLNITMDKDDYSELIRAREDNERLQAQVDELAAYIQANMPPTP